jgi:hypothetical protein
MRRALLVVGATALAVGVLTPAAKADVGVTPGQALQGDAVDLTFQVREDVPGAYTSKIELVLPDDAAVAEVDPLSVPDWAPKVTYTPGGQHTPNPGTQGQATPTPGTQGHAHGSGDMITSSITWYRVAKPSSLTAPSELRVSMGPLPQVDRLAFTVVQTYSDGQVRVSARGAGPVLTLRPAPAAADAAIAQPQTAATAPAADPSSGWPLAIGLVAGATFGLLMALLALGRRRRRPAEEAPLDEVLLPVDSDREQSRATSET